MMMMMGAVDVLRDVALDDMERRAAAANSSQASGSASVTTAFAVLSEPLVSRAMSDEDTTTGPVLVFAVGRAASRVIHGCEFAKLRGSVVVGEKSLANNAEHPSVADEACYLFVDESDGTVLVSCQYDELTSAQSDAVVRAIVQAMGASPPRKTVVLATMPNAAMRAHASPPAAAYFVETDATSSSSEGEDPVDEATALPLPPGNVVDGTAACMLTACQHRGWQARLFVAVSQTGGGLADATCGDEARKLADVLKSATGGRLGASVAKDPGVLTSTSSASLYA